MSKNRRLRKSLVFWGPAFTPLHAISFRPEPTKIKHHQRALILGEHPVARRGRYEIFAGIHELQKFFTDAAHVNKIAGDARSSGLGIPPVAIGWHFGAFIPIDHQAPCC
jgi:hypothetical protein